MPTGRCQHRGGIQVTWENVYAGQPSSGRRGGFPRAALGRGWQPPDVRLPGQLHLRAQRSPLVPGTLPQFPGLPLFLKQKEPG